MREPTPCKICGGAIPAGPYAGRTKYCSPDCAHAGGLERLRERRKAVTYRPHQHCRRCGDPFERLPGRNTVYCSPRCYELRKVERHRVKQGLPARPICKHCGGAVPMRFGPRTFCSQRCQRLDYYRRTSTAPKDHQKRECDVCGSTIARTARWNQIYCGQRCQTYALNRRRIAKYQAAKGRKRKRKPGGQPRGPEYRVSAEMIAARAAAIRQRKLDELRQSDPRPSGGWR